MVDLEAAKLTIRRAHLWKIASINDFRGDPQKHVSCQMVEVHFDPYLQNEICRFDEHG
jgi:hypothetical protein